MATDVVRLLGGDIPVQISGSMYVFQRATLRCGSAEACVYRAAHDPTQSSADLVLNGSEWLLRVG
jgi:hypothetical protein